MTPIAQTPVDSSSADLQTSVSFIVKNVNPNTRLGGVLLSFLVRGKNGNAYDQSVFENAVEVQLLSDTSMVVGPTIAAFTGGSGAGSSTSEGIITTKTSLSFDVQCNQVGTIYYVVYLCDYGQTTDDYHYNSRQYNYL